MSSQGLPIDRGGEETLPSFAPEESRATNRPWERPTPDLLSHLRQVPLRRLLSRRDERRLGRAMRGLHADARRAEAARRKMILANLRWSCRLQSDTGKRV